MSTDRDDDPPELPGLQFVRRLGRGGYADVFLYEQTDPRMRVAVKVLFGDSLSPKVRERFAAEANAMAELADHPNIVQVFRSGVTSDGRPYLVMKYYPQRNLAVRASTDRLSVPEVLRIGVQVACAVETAHRAGILHRDIKPGNILTSQYGEPGLADFGIATTGADEPDADGGLSIPWAPPEVVFGTSTGDRSADVYSLGATLWHLLVGRSPFEEPGGKDTSVALMRRIKEMPPPRTRRDDVPASLERLLAQTMAKAPDDRPKGAVQLARALQAIESEQRWSQTPLVLVEPDAHDDQGADAGPGHDGSRDDRTGTVGRPPMVAPAEAGGPGAGTAGPGQETRRRPVAAPPSRPAASSTGSPVPTDPPASRNAPTPAGSPASPGRPTAPAGPGGSSGDVRVGGGPRLPRARHGMPSPVDDPLTIERPKLAPPGPAAVAGAPEGEVVPRPVKPWRRWPLVAAVVVVAAGVGIGVALAEGSGRPPPTTTSSTSTPPTIVSQAPVAAPSQPVGTRVSPTDVRFTWTVPDQQTGQVVGWAATTSPNDITKVDGDTATVASTGPVCIVVYVKSANGQQEAQSTPGCGG